MHIVWFHSALYCTVCHVTDNEQLASTPYPWGVASPSFLSRESKFLSRWAPLRCHGKRRDVREDADISEGSAWKRENHHCRDRRYNRNQAKPSHWIDRCGEYSRMKIWECRIFSANENEMVFVYRLTICKVGVCCNAVLICTNGTTVL
jgi:hypothetical protein